MTNIIIDVAAEFTGKKAFDQAEKSTFNLQKSAKKLAKTFGIAFGTAAVINFGKEAVKAFAADEAAAIRLNRAVENLGIGFANPSINKFIADLERSSAIADDILRPAFQALLTTTGSLTKSQELLNNAIQISRASGIDLATVSQDLANGYVGITKGLKKYNTGLTTAELNSKSFADVLGVMLAKSAGAAQDYLSTTQYKMDALTLATGNASEIIGGGLVNAFARIAGGTEASDAQKAIEGVATGIAHITEATGAAIGAIPNLLKMLGNLPKNIFQGFAGKAAGVNITPTPTVTKTPTQITSEKQAKLLAKLEADAAKRAKELLALQKKQSIATKKAADEKARLDKAASVFDLQRIQIAAALKGKISEEEKTRLLLMQAIANEDANKAEKLQQKLEEIQKKNEEIAKSLTEISKVTNPFEDWAKSLSDASNLLRLMPALINANGSLTPRGLHNIPPEEILTNIADQIITAAEDVVSSSDWGFSLPGYLQDTMTSTASDIVNQTEDLTNSIVETITTATDSINNFGYSLPEYLASQIPSIPFAPDNSPTTNFVPSAVPSDFWGTGGFGFSVPGFNQPSITVNVTNEGSVIMQDEFVTAVTDAVNRTTSYGNNLYRPGAIIDLG